MQTGSLKSYVLNPDQPIESTAVTIEGTVVNMDAWKQDSTQHVEYVGVHTLFGTVSTEVFHEELFSARVSLMSQVSESKGRVGDHAKVRRGYVEH